MLEDRFGNTLSTQSGQAVECYVTALDRLFSMYSATENCDAAIGADSEFALAHCVRARALLFEGKTKQAVQAADHAVELAGNATAREQAHAEIVALVTRGDNTAALPRVVKHAALFPRDALPLSFALGVYGLLGFGGYTDHHEQQRDLLESVAHAWGEDWWFDAWLGWSYVETGQSDLGIPLLDRSLDVRPNNATAAHGRTHGFYETGGVAEGIAFLEAWLPSYGQDEPLHCHLAWHLGLFSLQLGDWQRAEEIYLNYISPGASQALPMFTLIDCAAFLWRSRLYGHRFARAKIDELAAFASEHFADPNLPFVNYHRTLVGAMADVEIKLDATTTGQAHDTSATLSEALNSYASARFAEAVDSLQEIGDVISALGGSHAQRDLIQDTHMAALLGAGQVDQAQAMADARALHRASHLDNKWFALLKGA